MGRLKFFFLLALFLCISTVDAAIYKGQKEFVKKCRSCHTEGQNFITKYTMKEWEDYFKENGKSLATLHIQTPKAKNSWSYFKGKRYSKKVKHLRQFLVEYAKDSGNVPACN